MYATPGVIGTQSVSCDDTLVRIVHVLQVGAYEERSKRLVACAVELTLIALPCVTLKFTTTRCSLKPEAPTISLVRSRGSMA